MYIIYTHTTSPNQTWQVENPDQNGGFDGKITYKNWISIATFDVWRLQATAMDKPLMDSGSYLGMDEQEACFERSLVNS